jgi:hypothetical protein
LGQIGSPNGPRIWTTAASPQITQGSALMSWLHLAQIISPRVWDMTQVFRFWQTAHRANVAMTTLRHPVRGRVLHPYQDYVDQSPARSTARNRSQWDALPIILLSIQEKRSMRFCAAAIRTSEVITRDYLSD